MRRIPEHVINEVRDRANIREVADQYVEDGMKKDGIPLLLQPRCYLNLIYLNFLDHL